MYIFPNSVSNCAYRLSLFLFFLLTQIPHFSPQATIANPCKHLHIYYPLAASDPHQCDGYLNTSAVGFEKRCVWATNGGPFIMGKTPPEPTCLGYIVSDSQLVQDTETSNVNFGITEQCDFVMGPMDSSYVQNAPFVQLVSGFGWLIQNGTVVPTAGGEIAPRTAVGVDAQGQLLSFAVNGIEKTYQGLTLRQLANWMKQLGAVYAVNLDGGGSTVAAVNGTIINYPTCSDEPRFCERLVTTMLCIR
jgi:N-acetylglucosamine-1-phosphodiester alpha-N-acetylglucosaminidase